MGMDDGLVPGASLSKCDESMLYPCEPERGANGAEFRPGAAGGTDSQEGAQGRILSLRTQLLPALSSGRTYTRDRGYLNMPYWLPLCDQCRSLVYKLALLPETEEWMWHGKV